MDKSTIPANLNSAVEQITPVSEPAMSYSTALQIVHCVAESNQPDGDDLDELDADVLEVVACQEEALESIEKLLTYFTEELNAIAMPADLGWNASSQADTLEGVPQAAEDELDDVDFSDPFFGIQLALLMASCTIGDSDDEVVVVDTETAAVARGAIRLVEYLLTNHRNEVASISSMVCMARTLN